MFRSAGEKPAEHGVLDAYGGQPGHRHQRGEPAEGQPAGREREQVGQVGHRQQQRRRVGQVRARVHVRPGPRLEPGRGGEHHRGEQHHRGVQAEPAVVTAAIRNTWARSLRGLPALVRAIQSPQARNSPSSSHRCASTRIAARKPMTGPELPGLVGGLAGRDRAGRDQDDRGRDRCDRLRPAARPGHRPGQHGEQGDQRDRLAGDGVQRIPSPGRCGGSPSNQKGAPGAARDGPRRRG